MGNPDDLTVLSLCSGGAGLDLGLRLAIPTCRTVCWVEREAFACAELVRRMEAGELDAAPLWTDLRTFDGRPWRGVVDCVIAGYPCQPFSTAGRRGGSDDPRHLWPHVRRVVEEVSPAVVFFENVSGHLTLGFREVAEDLERMGYEVAATLGTAAEVGASHRRERLFILGVADGEHSERRTDEQHDQLPRRRKQKTSRAGRTRPNVDRLDTGRLDVDDPGCQPGGPKPRKQQKGTRKPARPVGHADEGGRRGQGDGSEQNWIDSAGHGLADPIGPRSERPRQTATAEERGQPASFRGDGGTNPLFPPGPGDRARWADILRDCPHLAPATTKSVLRGVADGLADDRARYLRLLGNGVVPLQAAYAFVWLWECLVRTDET